MPGGGIHTATIMGGRGRGRGRGAVPPSVASAHFGSGNFGGSPSTSTSGIYTSKAEPSQKFPVTSECIFLISDFCFYFFKDILIPETPNFDKFSTFQLKSAEYSDKIDSLLKFSASFRPIKTTQQKIDRYSDKYLSHVINSNDRRERISSIQSNLEFFPEELHSVYQSDTSGSKRKKSSVTSTVSFKDTLNHLESLAQKEESNNEEEKEKEDEEDGAAGEEIEDEEFEDETDYNYSYFDNGEDHGDYDDGNDEAVF